MKRDLADTIFLDPLFGNGFLLFLAFVSGLVVPCVGGTDRSGCEEGQQN